MRFAIVIEKAEGNYSAYVPDLPGCVATGPTVEAVERGIRDAIRFHIEGLEQDGQRSRSDEPRGICRDLKKSLREAGLRGEDPTPAISARSALGEPQARVAARRAVSVVAARARLARSGRRVTWPTHSDRASAKRSGRRPRTCGSAPPGRCRCGYGACRSCRCRRRRGGWPSARTRPAGTCRAAG